MDFAINIWTGTLTLPLYNMCPLTLAGEGVGLGGNKVEKAGQKELRYRINQVFAEHAASFLKES